MSIIIRFAVSADRDALSRQFLEMNVYEHAICNDRRTDCQGAIQSLDDSWERVKNSDGIALVADLGNSLVGHLFLLFRQDGVFVAEEFQAYAYISEFFVTEDLRGSGIGRALLQEAERHVAARGVRRLRLDVLNGNASGQAFYTRSGFSPYALKMIKTIDP